MHNEPLACKDLPLDTVESGGAAGSPANDEILHGFGHLFFSIKTGGIALFNLLQQ
jgi:hypothetical protein